ncbi:MAG TPA: hypothetical protein VIE64_00485 [Solirubrobacterales bacterium]
MPEDVARRFGSESNEWTKVLGRLARGWPMATMMLTGELGISTERLVRIAETLRELGLARRLPFGDEPWFGVTKLGVRLHRDRLSSASRDRDCGVWISERQLCRPRESGSHRSNPVPGRGRAFRVEVDLRLTQKDPEELRRHIAAILARYDIAGGSRATHRA